MSKDADLHPTSRAINLNHHLEEARHLAFGRQIVRDLWERHAPQWSPETTAGIRATLANFIKTTWREYYNPDVYADAQLLREWPAAGSQNVWDLQAMAWSSPASRQLRQRYSQRWAGLLLKSGILEEVSLP
jgi:hypothetical protein